MKIIIKTKNLDLTPALKEFIEEKIGSLKKFLKSYEKEGEALVEVEVSRTSKHHHKGDVFYAEVNLQLGRKMLRAEDDDFDARVAVNKVKDILKREIDKYKQTH